MKNKYKETHIHIYRGEGKENEIICTIPVDFNSGIEKRTFMVKICFTIVKNNALDRKIEIM